MFSSVVVGDNCRVVLQRIRQFSQVASMTGSVRQSNGSGQLDKWTREKRQRTDLCLGVAMDILHQTGGGSYTWNQTRPISNPPLAIRLLGILSSPLIAGNTSFLSINSTYRQGTAHKIKEIHVTVLDYLGYSPPPFDCRQHQFFVRQLNLCRLISSFSLGNSKQV